MAMNVSHNTSDTNWATLILCGAHSNTTWQILK